jgi:glutamate--cysteine ligase
MLHTIAQKFSEKEKEIWAFFEKETSGLVPPIYLSCDIRNSGKKLGVIDTNLFPAGFNNLCNAYSRRTVLAFKDYFRTYLPGTQRVILLIEEHTRNRFYLDNVHRLNTLLTEIGLETRIAYPGKEVTSENMTLTLSDHSVLHLGKLKVKNGVPQVDGFAADQVISNNDFSTGLPEDLAEIADKILPHPRMGWQRRRKSRHFALLSEIITRFARVVEVDPWFLECLFSSAEEIDLTQNRDVERLASKAARILEEVRGKYEAHRISDPPYAFVKNNAGTYGMGLMDIQSSEEILQMNRRVRNKLLSSKGGKRPDSFLIQEGIPTADFYSGLPIEPVIYLVGFEVVGGFFRMNAEKDAMASLNSPGMKFSCLCLHKLDEPHEAAFLNCAEKENLVGLASVMAKLAALAAAREKKEL